MIFRRNIPITARLFALVFLCLAAVPAAASAAAVLVMGEEKGCMWCARWNAEVAPEYPKTDEGRAAPLRRIDIHAPMPPDLEFKSRLTYSPTFVLIVDGREVSRLEGYPGEDFFWGLLQRMLDEAGIEFRGEG